MGTYDYFLEAVIDPACLKKMPVKKPSSTLKILSSPKMKRARTRRRRLPVRHRLFGFAYFGENQGRLKAISDIASESMGYTAIEYRVSPAELSQEERPLDSVNDAEQTALLRDRLSKNRLRTIEIEAPLDTRSANDIIITIATNHPVMAGDLRKIASILEVVGELERIGDYTKGIGAICLRLSKQPPIKLPIDIPCTAELSVDCSTILADQPTIDRVNLLMWAAHNLERVADRVSSICERIVYTATGQLMEFPS